MIIAMEGIDASGKATQSRLLTDALKGILFSFPNYKTHTGQIIRKQLEDGNFDPLVFQSLMICNRLEAHSQIMTADSCGHVIMDRYTISGIVYSQADGVPKGWVEMVSRSIIPADLHVLIDIPISLSVERRPERRDSYERDSVKLEKIRGLYLDYFQDKRYTQTHVIVDGTQSIEKVHRDIMAFTTSYLAWKPPILQGGHR